jgi:hypothetical protein
MLARRLLTTITGGSFAGRLLTMNTPNFADVIGLRVRQAETKQANTPTAGVETTIFTVASGAGAITSLWLTFGNGSAGYTGFDLLLQVYTDGSGTPDIAMDVGTFFGYAYTNNLASGYVSSQNFSAFSNGASHNRVGGQCLLPIPFTNGVTVTLKNVASSVTQTYYSQVGYALTADNAGWAQPPYRLHTNGVTAASSTAGPASGVDFTLHSISGGPGIIVAHSMCAVGASSLGYLERNVGLFIDGEGSASIESSGSEDWWRHPWYFNWGNNSAPAALSWGTSGNYFSALVDFAALTGGYAFTSSAILKWLTNAQTSSDVSTYASCLHYYLHT